ncbi:MAG: flagellar hook capping protein [Actinobacteria bacterium]|jgi:flagellar basal-body rod modification protein FlgD|nr:flagellar hook capping protein [Actinomycetota bacterium]
MPVQPIQYATAPASGPMGTPSTASKGASSQVDNGTGMGSDAFLKLLVAQLKYQDPTNPASGTEFLAQTAQFTMVEKLTSLASSNADVLASQRALQAGQLVGAQVTYTDGSATKTGTVTAAKLLATGPVLVIGGAEVPLSSVTQITTPDGSTA